MNKIGAQQILVHDYSLSLIEHMNDEMKAVTEAKFKQWDECVEKGYLESTDKKLQKFAYDLLADPSIYAYAFFRDRNGERFKVYPYQDIILNDPQTKVRSRGRVMFVAANQIGKSITLCLHALHSALNNPGKNFMMVSRNFTQAKDLLRQIKAFLTSSTIDYKYSIGETETSTEITFKHYEERIIWDKETNTEKVLKIELPESRIVCVAATEAALGYPIDGMYLDELAFFEDGKWFYQQIAQPRTYHTKGFIMEFSNPNGQQGIYWDHWNSPRFKKYVFNFLDCPVNSQQEFDEIAADLTQERIDSTLLAIFTNPEGGFLNMTERKLMQEERPNLLPEVIENPLYVFYDFAKVKDRTVRIIGVPMNITGKPGVYVYEMKEYPSGTDYSAVIADLEALIMKVGFGNIAMVGWDNNGVGAGVEAGMRKIMNMGVVCNPVEFSLVNKSAMYTLFKLLAERNIRGEKGILIPKIDACDKQLSKLRFKKSERGYLQVHHEKEGDRDDYPDAIAGLCSLIIQPENVPVTAVLITNSTSYSNSKGEQTDEMQTSTRPKLNRCECGNILDDWDDQCSFCLKER